MVFSIGSQHGVVDPANILVGNGNGGTPIEIVKLGDGAAGAVTWQRTQTPSGESPVVHLTPGDDLTVYDSGSSLVSASDISVDRPKRLTAGDILLVFVNIASSYATTSSAALFSKTAEVTNTSFGSGLACFWRPIKNPLTEPSAYNDWLGTSRSRIKAVMFRVTGANLSVPVDGQPQASESRNAHVDTYACPSVTASVGKTIIVTAQGIRNIGTTSHTWINVPGQKVIAMDKERGTYSAALAVSWREGPAASGAVGPWQFTRDYSTPVLAMSVVLKS